MRTLLFHLWSRVANIWCPLTYESWWRHIFGRQWHSFWWPRLPSWHVIIIHFLISINIILRLSVLILPLKLKCFQRNTNAHMLCNKCALSVTKAQYKLPSFSYTFITFEWVSAWVRDTLSKHIIYRGMIDQWKVHSADASTQSTTRMNVSAWKDSTLNVPFKVSALFFDYELISSQD